MVAFGFHIDMVDVVACKRCADRVVVGKFWSQAISVVL